MLTLAQRETYLRAMNEADTEVVPPRLLPSNGGPDGMGDLLLVGRKLADGHPLAECECGNEHVFYIVIRDDGAWAGPFTSGTFEELLINPYLWEDARIAVPGDWPEEAIRDIDIPM